MSNTFIKNLGWMGFPLHCVTEEGNVYSIKSGKYLNQTLNHKGYPRVALFYNGNRKTASVHRLVLTTFSPVIGMEDLEVNHKDGNKLNNHVSNLEWMTSLENTQHAIENNLRSVHYKLTEEDVHIVCKYLQDGMRNKDISEITGISASHISGIKTGRYYKDIVDEYNISFIKKADRISTDKIVDVCKLLESGEKDYRIAKEMNVNHRIVGQIRKRLIYQTISSNYNW